jgi:hypothetical protein
MKNFLAAVLCVVAAAACLAPLTSFAGGGGMGGGTMSLQTMMNSPDNEWAVISTRIVRVENARAAVNTVVTGRGMGGGVTGNDPVSIALNDLVTALNADPPTATAIIKTKLQAFRDAKVKARDELKAAQQDLRQLLTMRQECIMFWQGYLD